MKSFFRIFISIIFIIVISCSNEKNPVEPINNQPVTTIVSPPDLTNFLEGDTIIFAATATDVEDGDIPDSSIVWTSDKDGQIGTGISCQIDSLSANSHIIILSATDSKGLIGFDTVTVMIHQNSVPVVSIISPADNSSFNNGDTISFTATATDVEDEYIPDSSIVWTSDKDGQIGAGLSYQMDSLSNNSHMIILSATDSKGLIGFDTVTVMIHQNSVPVVSIISPADNSSFNIGDTISFTATATDVEDGDIPDSSIVWTSDKDGQIGTGNTLTTSTLSLNSHLISIMATDSDNNLTTAYLRVGVFNTFEKTFGWPLSTSGLSVCETFDEGYIIAGANESHFYAIKTDKTGNLVWGKVYLTSSTGVARSVCETSEGSYILAGSVVSDAAGESDIYLIKIDNNGNLIWEKTIGYVSSDDCRSVISTSDNGIVLTGSTYANGRSGWDELYLYLIKLDYYGDIIWEKTIGGAARKQGNSVIETSDEGLIIAGTSYGDGGSGNYNILLIKTDMDGNISWEKTFGGGGIQYGFSVCEASDGGYIVVGTTGATDMYIIKVDAVGNLIWESSVGGERTDNGKSVKQTSDGNYIVVGTNASYGLGDNDIWLVKIDKEGGVIWERTFDRSTYDFGSSVDVTSDGGYIITGSTSNYRGGRNVYLIKTDFEGKSY